MVETGNLVPGAEVSVKVKFSGNGVVHFGLGATGKKCHKGCEDSEYVLHGSFIDLLRIPT